VTAHKEGRQVSDQKAAAGVRSRHAAQMQITNWWTRKLAATAALVLALVLAGLNSCGQANPRSGGSPPSTVSKAQAYAAAISEVRDYLVVWRERGCPVATKEFLVQDGGCDLILRSGKVISYRPYHWVSSNHFTLMVTLDLHFEGSPGAWNVGLNSRFITFSRTGAQGRYLLEFATGP
jgi:hypothetical protein